jgi:hypothetical protein
MEKHFNEQNELPDSLPDFRETIKAGFGRRIVPVTPAEKRFDLFNGLYWTGNREGPE